METTKSHHTVIIAGGGLGGLTLAAMLRQLHVDFVVLERAKELRAVGAAISLAPNALRVLDQLGVYDVIRPQAQPVKRVDVYRNSTRWSSLSFSDVEALYGYPVLKIERHAFHHALYDAAGADAHTLFSAELIDIEDQPGSPVKVKLADGRELTADLVIGADGIRSATRRALARNLNAPKVINTIKFTGRVHFSGYTSPLPHLKKEDIGVGHWIFLDRGATLTTWPCIDNRQWFIGVMLAKPGEDPSESIWKDTSRQTIADIYGQAPHPFGKDGTFGNVLDHSERVIASNVFAETEFPSMAAGRVALLGDAGHAITSFFGQGACQAIEDATELCNALVESLIRQSQPVETALQLYAERRMPRTKSVSKFSDSYAMMHTARLPYNLGPLVRKVMYSYVPERWLLGSLGWLYAYQPVVHGLPNFTNGRKIAQPNAFLT
ncbi:hypothetical protein CF319_g5482 [Tilletia indica]|nr:hypothetical protein CF319_g5482 [Tilletia indica]